MVTPRKSLVRLALAANLLAAMHAAAARAAIVIDLPDVSVTSNGVTPTAGVLEVFVTLTGADLSSPPNFSSFNIDITASSPHVAFGAASAAVTSPLFSAGTFTDFGTAQRVLAAHDVFEVAPGYVTANNAGLVRVPFTVAAGQTGTFTLNLGPLTQLAYANATAAMLTTFTGSIIVAVPEVGAWAMLFAALGIVLGRRLWRRA
jgi:hypothetical protein